MQNIDIKKVANGYLVEVCGDYDEIDEEIYLYKTREEMQSDLENVVQKAHELSEKIRAAKDAKAASKG